MIHHVAVETPRAAVDACVAFYGLLGFEPVTPPPGLVDVAAWVERDGQQIHLLYVDGPDDAVVPPEGHVAVVCPDYEATVARLRAAGFAFEPRTEHWGSPRCFVSDPAGHRVEVMQFPPAST
ncbi:MAG TPA: VOC family protein [Capillimicrobium sp.]|nr:VOC family protein [Capillimicrobium sp.]